MPSGPSIVAVQDRRLPSADGKADIPGAGEVMRVISSVCNLFVTLPESTLRVAEGRALGSWLAKSMVIMIVVFRKIRYSERVLEELCCPKRKSLGCWENGS